MLFDNIVVIDGDDSLYEDLGRFLGGKTINCFSDVEEAFSFVSKIKPDMIVSELLLPNSDGFDFIQRVKAIYDDIRFVFCSSITQDKFIAKAMNLGADYYMVKPVNCQILANRILDVFEMEGNQRVVPMHKTRLLDEKISNIFMTVGIPAHIKGYRFLREAIKMSVEDPSIINSITKRLYPSIADKFETSASKVERAIRHAIEVAWNRGKIENINNLFGVEVYSSNEKPTNGEFIALVADKMLMES